MIRKPFRKFFLIILTLALLAPLPTMAAATNLVTDGTFESLAPGPIATGTYTVGSNDGSWLAGSANWIVVAGGPTLNYAHHTITGTDLLIQGFSIANKVTGTCIGAGWTVKLSFSYQNVPPTGAVQIAGFNAGGTWDPSSGAITNGTLLTPATTAISPTGTGWGTYQTSVVLTQDFVALGVGFNLDSVDNVVVEVVAPVSLKITPNTLNAKSQGQWVTAFISNPPSCYKLKNIDPGSILLTFGQNPGFAPDMVNSQGNKFMLKFDRQQLITMLNGATGNLDLTLTGNFLDGIAFAGTTTLHVIKPGKGPKK